MADVVGSAFLGVAVTPGGKLFFLRVVAAIPNAMLCMTATAATVQKAAVGRSKSPLLAVKKTADCKPLPNPPQGAGIHSRCALGGGMIVLRSLKKIGI